MMRECGGAGEEHVALLRAVTLRDDGAFKVEAPVCGGALSFEAHVIGCDVAVLVAGGAGHIGCTVLAVPRPSLAGDGSISATSSAVNVCGHKDDAVCRHVAERLCAQLGCIVTCTGGIHFDNLTAADITKIQQTATRLCNALLEKMIEEK